MFLTKAKVGPFKSINTPQIVKIDKEITVLVGMNEAGKTVFLQTLKKSNDALNLTNFNPIEDYPRKDLTQYQKKHSTKPDPVTVLTYSLTDQEVTELNDLLHTKIPSNFEFSVTHLYDNQLTIGLTLDEKPVVDFLLDDGRLSSDTKKILNSAANIRAIPTLLKDKSLTPEETVFLNEIEKRISTTTWESVVKNEIWEWLKNRIPKFLYFSDYDVLPSKMNLNDLAQRESESKTNPGRLESKHRSVLALLRMADISVSDFTSTGGYEPLKAKIEAVSINLTDQIMEFWKQNEDLDVEVDIKQDPQDVTPFNNGPNLYLRIKNRRHRGVSTPFDQRSRGFIWFFSFLVWFDSVHHQIDRSSNSDLILLLDEPALALHALAQADFLRYIDNLSQRHQVLYTTHSPFMIHSDRLHQVRTVEDQLNVGTVISDNVMSADSRTSFPLQAALGWTMAQNLFISERNLLVEGPSELIYLKAMSSFVEKQGGKGLREDITIVPVGGLDKVVTFVALLGANGLKLAVLHDYNGSPDQKLMDLVKQKIIIPKMLLNASQFRDLTKIGKDGKPTDTEDLFTVSLYLDCFNKAFDSGLKGQIIGEADIPAGDRIVDRLERYLQAKSIQLRPSGGFNHYTVATYFASNPPAKIDADTLKRFEAAFTTINSLFE